DTSGNVLHYVLRDASSERRQELLSYVAYLVDRGRIGTTAREAAITAHVENGRVHLQRNSALRHENRPRQAADGRAEDTPGPQGKSGQIDWNFPAVERVEQPKNLSPTDWQRLREKIRGSTATA